MNTTDHQNYVGIDISKKTLDYTILRGKQLVAQGSIENSPKGLVRLKKHLKKEGISLSKILFCCENTGHYNYQLLSWCQRENLNIWVESALAIKKVSGLQEVKTIK